jgi:hypothetical protein
VSKTGASGWSGDVNQVVAGRALDLASGKLHSALEMLLAMGAFEFELAGWHNRFPFRLIVCNAYKLQSVMRNLRLKRAKKTRSRYSSSTQI